LWGVNFIKENYSQFVESRGIDVGHEIFQIFPETSETEGGKTLWLKRTSGKLVKAKAKAKVIRGWETQVV
jgi:hypothetical protein